MRLGHGRQLPTKESPGGVVPALNTAIDDLNLTNEATSTTPVNPVFGSVVALLTTVRVSSFLFRDETYQVYT